MPIKNRLNFASGVPKVMGILNVTPDSFSDGGNYVDVSDALGRIRQMVRNGADIIDVGGESTRPGSDPVSEEEELERVIPILEKAIPEFKETIFSIDTTKYKVAQEALGAGVAIVNDVSGLQKEPRLAELCAKYNSYCVIMHSQGDPKTMQDNPTYQDVVEDLTKFFETQIKLAKSFGADKIILDPGIGFGKTVEQNLKLIAHLDAFKKFGYPILIGASRKSTIGKILDDRPVDDRLAGTLAIHYHAMMKGADILRVHDVKEAKDSVRIFHAIQSQH